MHPHTVVIIVTLSVSNLYDICKRILQSFLKQKKFLKQNHDVHFYDCSVSPRLCGRGEECSPKEKKKTPLSLLLSCSHRMSVPEKETIIVTEEEQIQLPQGENTNTALTNITQKNYSALGPVRNCFNPPDWLHHSVKSSLCLGGFWLF